MSSPGPTAAVTDRRSSASSSGSPSSTDPATANPIISIGTSATTLKYVTAAA
jgi:hypothetical protein